MSDTPSYQRFFAELKRRKVFKVAAVYGAVAFGVLQAADVLIPALHLPESFITAIAAIAILGFPASIAMAWVFDRTPEGLVRTAEAAEGELSAIAMQSRGQRWPVGIAAVLGTALLVSGVWWVLGRDAATGSNVGEPAAAAALGADAGAGAAPGAAPGAAGDEISIAVLPFVNMSGDPENEYFSDGLSEELINALVTVDGLKVAARTSAFAFRGQERDVREIATELGVGHVLEGSVRKSGDRVRITAQLIQAEEGFHLWSDVYDRELTDIFAVQEEIAEAIAEQLKLTVTAEGRSTMARRRTEDLEAYDMYLLGRHQWATRSETGLFRAKEYFEEVIRRDPTFAPAWSALSGVYGALPWYTRFDPAEALATGREAARRAIELDPASAEAHAVLAVIEYEYGWNWDAAEAEFEIMLELDPEYALGLNWYCQLLVAIGRVSEGVALCRRAYSLDPLFFLHSYIMGNTLAATDSLDEALAMYDRALELQPGVPEVDWEKGGFLLLAGRLDEAAGAFETWLRKEGVEGPERMGIVMAGMEDAARRTEATEVLRAFEAQNRVDSVLWAPIAAELGEIDHAMELVEAAYAAGNPYMTLMGTDPRFASIREHPRAHEIIHEMGLPVGRID
jgi:serine/threonine-protein kinase